MAYGYRTYDAPSPLLIGYDPFRDLPDDHLARLIEHVVEQVPVPAKDVQGPGQPEYHPRLCLKVLLYGYATGTRSSRLLAQACRESLPYIYLARGEHPSHTVLNSFRKGHTELVEEAWVVLFAVAEDLGLKRVGRITVDTMKLRANASRESVVEADEYEVVLKVLREVLAEADAVDEREDREGFRGGTQLGQAVEKVQMREILRRARKRLGMDKKKAAKGKEQSGTGSAAAGASSGAKEEVQAALVEAAAAAAEERQPAVEGDAAAAADGEVQAAGVPAAVAREEEPSVVGGAAAASKDEGQRTPGDGCATAEAVGASTAEAAASGVDDAVQRWWLGEQMRQRVEESIRLLEEAAKSGRKHLSLTDPDAQMMCGGVDKRVRERHSFEVAVDEGAGLLVAGGTTQEPNDNARLQPLIAAAQKHEPGGVKAATGDSGFYNAGVIGALLRQGFDLCVPDSSTAGDLHRGLPIGTTRAKTAGGGTFAYDPATNAFHCSEGNILEFHGRRVESGRQITEYRAVRPCVECPLVGTCLTCPKGKHRTIRVDEYEKELTEARQRFNEPEHKERYGHRGERVEGVFGFLSGVLGYTRWLLRRKEGVVAEGRLFKAAYQIRKVYRPWAASVAAA